MVKKASMVQTIVRNVEHSFRNKDLWGVKLNSCNFFLEKVTVMRATSNGKKTFFEKV